MELYRDKVTYDAFVQKVEDYEKSESGWYEDELHTTGVIVKIWKRKHACGPFGINLRELYEGAPGDKKLSWDNLDNMLRHAIANGFKQKVVDGLAGKGKKADYSFANQLVVMGEHRTRFIDERVWNKPGQGGVGGLTREDRALKSISEMEKDYTVKIEGLEESIKAAPKDKSLVMVKEALESMRAAIRMEGKSRVEWEEDKLKKATVARKINQK